MGNGTTRPKNSCNGFYGCIFKMDGRNWYVRWTPGETDVDFITPHDDWKLVGSTNLILADGKERPSVEQLENLLRTFIDEENIV